MQLFWVAKATLGAVKLVMSLLIIFWIGNYSSQIFSFTFWSVVKFNNNCNFVFTNKPVKNKNSLSKKVKTKIVKCSVKLHLVYPETSEKRVKFKLRNTLLVSLNYSLSFNCLESLPPHKFSSFLVNILFSRNIFYFIWSTFIFLFFLLLHFVNIIFFSPISINFLQNKNCIVKIIKKFLLFDFLFLFVKIKYLLSKFWQCIKIY